MRILVTGGAGYIGSHAALALLEAGHVVTIVDDLSHGHREIVDLLLPLGDLVMVHADAGDRTLIAQVLRDRNIELVMHFAARAYVGESVQMPLQYYRANTAASLGLLEAMAEAGVHQLIFSSTCSTYGEPAAEQIPIDEMCPQQPVNPYGRSKLFVEHMIRDFAMASNARGEPFRWAALRYFNVAGCDPKGRLGEDHDPETHLVPICIDAALGRRDAVTIFGGDYPTPDGTCIRDYVHVTDLVDAHLHAMHALSAADASRAGIVYNVGIGSGYSVREVVDAVAEVTGAQMQVIEGARRPGDPPSLYCNPARVSAELGWTARYTLQQMIEHAWRWRRDHPRGYRT